MDFVSQYAKARTVRQKILCMIAKITYGTVVSPIGRIVLSPKDYKAMAIKTRNEDLLDD